MLAHPTLLDIQGTIVADATFKNLFYFVYFVLSLYRFKSIYLCFSYNNIGLVLKTF